MPKNEEKKDKPVIDKSVTKTTGAKKTTTEKSVNVEEAVNRIKKATASATKATTAPASKTTAKANVAKATPAPKKAPAKKSVITPPLTKIKDPNAPLKILFVAPECAPFATSGGLGEVIGSLPQALNANGSDARVILPLYECFPEKLRDKLRFITHINVGVSWRQQYCGVHMLELEGVKYYFIDNEYYFKRKNLYGYDDEAERFAFFSRAVLDVLPYIEFTPDVIHAHDWQTALVPIYYKLYYMNRSEYEDIKTLFTIHNIEYQGKFDYSIIEDVLGIPKAEYLSIEWKGGINLMKGAMDYSDYISTVSPTYAEELQYEFFAHGLEDVVKRNSYKMRGILNGINLISWNPASDKALFSMYSNKDFGGKAINKAELQKMLSLPVRPNTPIIALITRLVKHKGVDLVKGVLEELLKKDVQIVVLGTGDKEFENFFEFITDVYRDKFHAIIDFNNDLAHKIFAGTDMFLMPSKSEPCGLGQMIATRYGTIPIIRATGGLKDSIPDCANGDMGLGFVFENYDPWHMLHALERAIGLYKDYPEKWAGLVNRALSADFSWEKSAIEYIEMYKNI
ncbi:MAG: glycogen synthase GlgA [Firmicutes bacterium]|nr:glycogen synthase GlgA [Bacillota bacterium]